MQSLLQFIRRNFHYFLFLLLQIISLFALIRFNRYHQSVFFNTASALQGNVLNQRKSVISYFALKTENQRLKEENILLRTRGTENYIFIDTDSVTVKDSNRVVQYSYIPAKVIYNSIRKSKNYFTIDRGTKHNVRKGMGVISPLGVAGHIIDVAENFSIAMSILNEDFVLTPKINGKVRYGNVRWDGKDPGVVQITRISDLYEVKVGQEVTTTEFGHFFPKDIKIGNVVSVEKSEKGKYWDIEVELATDMRQLGEVYIIKNRFRDELEELEKPYIDEQ